VQVIAMAAEIFDASVVGKTNRPQKVQARHGVARHAATPDLGRHAEATWFDFTRHFQGCDAPAGQVRLEVMLPWWVALLVNDAQPSQERLKSI
jgi:hypothetical protein